MNNKSSLRICVVVLNWNGINDTKKCLSSLLNQTYDNYEIVVVDNGSNDDSVSVLSKLQEQHTKITLITNETNKGFSGGVNTGIAYAIDQNFDGVALFNNDAVADTQWLSELAKHFTDDRSIITGLLLNSDGSKIDSTSEEYSRWGVPFPNNRGVLTHSSPPSSYVFGATGGATLYKTALFQEIGLFDETFFAYYEDVDVSFRTQLIGQKIYFTHKALAYHQLGATSSKIPGFRVYQHFKNLPLLFWKNIPFSLLFRVWWRFTLLYTAMFFKAVITGSGWPAFKGFLMSVYYFWTSALWKRLSIQHKKRVSSTYIWSILYPDLPPDQTGMRRLRKILIRK